jgi:hypothetical protein
MARKSVVSLASSHGEADEVAQKVSLLKGELAVVRLAWDTAEVKLPGLVDRTVDIDQ